MYADFNSTHGLTFAGASGTTACANITELEYGEVQGDADQLQGSLDMVTREAGEEVVTTDVRTSELEEHDRITPHQVGFTAVLHFFSESMQSTANAPSLPWHFLQNSIATALSADAELNWHASHTPQIRHAPCTLPCGIS